jgi:glyoxylase-like metal-dependent hydrolase (beta-lactamase superfamily II)
VALPAECAVVVVIDVLSFPHGRAFTDPPRGAARPARRMGHVDGRWVEVGDGVLARRYAELDLTVGLIGADRALVVDTRGDARQGVELAAAVRETTALPLVVAITHAHFDHCFGTAAFLPAPVHALPVCREVLAATADAQRSEWVAHYRSRGDDLTADSLATTDPPLPDSPAPAELDLGGRVVDLRHLGRGHTDHDLVAHVPDAGVVFAGDLVEQGAPPAFEDAVVAEWPGTLTALLGLGPRVVVPGHGDPVDRAFVAEQRDRLTEVAELHAAVARGDLEAAEAAARSPYPDVPWP